MSHHYPVPARCPLLLVCPDSVSRQVAQKPLSEVLLFPVPVAPFVGPMFPVPVVPSVGPRSLVLAALSVTLLFPVPVAPFVGMPFPVQKSLEDWFLVPVSEAVLFQESESQAQVFLWSDSLSSLSPVQQD